MIKRILSIIMVCMGCLTLWAQSTDNRYGGDFNPTSPTDPAVPEKPQVTVTYRLTLLATEGGTVSHNASGTDFQAGTRLRLTASVHANYKFKHWLQGDSVVSTQTSFYYTMPAKAVTLKAVFEFYPGAYGGDLNPSDPSQPGVSVKSYKLTASASPASRGSVNCSSSSVQVGGSAYVTAAANAGYRFTGWKCGDELVSTEPYYPFVMDNKDAHYTAYFEFAPSSPTEPNASSYTLTYSIGGRHYYSELLTVGTRITPIADPVRKGHTFNGWGEVPDTMPNRNLTINGSFAARKHELLFVVDGEEIKRDSVTYGTVIAAPEVDATGEKSFKWHNMPALMPDHDVVVEGVYSSVKYNVIYRVDGEEYKRVEYDEGAPVYYEIPPIKEGYTFEGWVGVPTVMPQNYVVATGSLKPSTTFSIVYIIDGMKYHTERVAAGEAVSLLVPNKEGYLFNGWNETLTTMPNHDVYLVGSFRVALFDITYMVDGKVHKTTTVRMGDAITPEAAPVKEGYTFSGWSGLPETMPAQDITVTASYVANRYKITYTVDGEVYHTDSIAYGTSLKAIDIPVKDGHTFFGWSPLPETMPANDVTVTGSFVVNAYKLTYKVDGEVYRTDSLAYGTPLTAIAAPVKEGHTFSGWSEMPGSMPANDIVVEGSFTVNTYRITYTLEDEVIHTDSIVYGTKLTAIAAPTKEGHTFSGWVGLPETMPAKDVAVTGTYVVNFYKVTYMVDSVAYQTDSIAYGASLTAIAAPVKEGHTFSGWSEMPDTMPANDIVVEGSFTVNTYRITYTLEDEVIHTDSIVYGTKLTAIAAPTKEGHTFSGWTGLPETMPAKDVAVTGTYVVNFYKVTYMVDSVAYQTDSIAYGASLTAIAAPVKEGHTFSGWSEMPETMPANDIVVEGSFTVNTYRITYTLEDEVIHTDSIVYGTPLTAIDVPAKEGHTFGGWVGLPETMPASDVVVTGSYAINSYAFTYMVDGEVYKKIVYVYGAAITPEAAPVKEGYSFGGWSEVPKTMPAGDVVVTGNFTINTYNVTYMIDGEVYYTDSIEYSTGITPLPEPTKEGYTFSGWSEIPDTMPANNVMVVATFTVNTYRITYMLDGEVYYTSMVVYGSTITPPASPMKEGYTFSGWEGLPETMPAMDITVNGGFDIGVFKIIYMIDGEVYHTSLFQYEEEVTPIEDPTKEGYTFSGWSEIPDTMPAWDVTVRGSFILNSKQTDRQGLIYELNEARDAFEVGGYTDDLEADVVIPSELYGLPVTTIQAVALAFAEMESLVVPASITTVGRKAFGDCEELFTIEWNTTAPLDADYFSRVSNYGNMLVYVADAATEVSFQGNVVVDGVAEQITLIDELPFRNIHAFTARNIQFTRNFTKKTMIGVVGGWEALMLPFDVQEVTSENRGAMKPFGQADFTNSIPYWIAELQENGSFAYTDSIKANVPFIMEVPNSDRYQDIYNIEGNVTFSAENTIVHVTTGTKEPADEGYTLLGTYEGVSSDSYVYALNGEEYTLDGGTVGLAGSVFVADARDILPFEAYVYGSQIHRTAYLYIGSENGTGLCPPVAAGDASDDAWYTLQGVRLDARPVEKGTYIYGGKVVLVK